MAPFSVLSLSTILITIIAAALVFNRLHLPFVLGVLLAGVLLGPHSPLAGIRIDSFDLSELTISETSTVDFLAYIGAILVLFEIGLEFSLGRLQRLGWGAILAAFIKIGFVFLLGYTASMAFGFGVRASLFIGVILSMSSTPLIIRILRERDLIERAEVPLIVAVLILEDVFAVFSLAFLSSLAREPSAALALPLALAKTILAFAFAYIVLAGFLKRFVRVVAYSEEALLLTALTVTLGMAWAGDALGVSPSIGAFLAGSVLAGLPEAKQIWDGLRHFAVLFSALFFFSIGMLADLGAVLQNLPLALAFTAIAIFGKFTGASISAYFTGFRGRSSSFIGIAMLTLSEVSLLVAKEGAALNIIDIDVLSIASVVIFVSVLATSLLITRENEVYALAVRVLPSELLWMGRRTAGGLREVREALSAPRPVPGRAPARVYDELLPASLHAVGFLFAAVTFLTLSVLLAPGAGTLALAAISVLMLAAFLSVILAVLRIKRVIDLTLSAVLKEEGRAGALFIRDLSVAFILIALAFLSPLATPLIPSLLVTGLAVLLLLVALLYIWSASLKAKTLVGNSSAQERLKK
ncbi:MAG: cation:proton antiporter [Candidatus Micrarchaeia archaeon]